MLENKPKHPVATKEHEKLLDEEKVEFKMKEEQQIEEKQEYKVRLVEITEDEKTSLLTEEEKKELEKDMEKEELEALKKPIFKPQYPGLIGMGRNRRGRVKIELFKDIGKFLVKAGKVIAEATAEAVALCFFWVPNDNSMYEADPDIEEFERNYYQTDIRPTEALLANRY